MYLIDFLKIVFADKISDLSLAKELFSFLPVTLYNKLCAFLLYIFLVAHEYILYGLPIILIVLPQVIAEPEAFCCQKEEILIF